MVAETDVDRRWRRCQQWHPLEMNDEVECVLGCCTGADFVRWNIDSLYEATRLDQVGQLRIDEHRSFARAVEVSANKRYAGQIE